MQRRLLTLCLLNAPAFAHTTLETSTLPEGTRVLNNLQIGHACGAGTRTSETNSGRSARRPHDAGARAAAANSEHACTG